jgi:Fe-S cluster assembly protein SufD
MNVELRRTASAAEQAATDQFGRAAGSLPGTAWVRDMRSGAIARFAEAGLPHRRIEEWKYTDLRAALRELPAPAAGKGLAPAPGTPVTLAEVDAYRIVVTDGGAPRIADDIPGVEVRSLEQALAEDDPALRALISEWPRGVDSPVFDLNTAFMRAGAVIRVKPDTALDKPIHLAFVTTGAEEATIYARNLLVVGDGASVTFIESYEGPDDYSYHVNVATRFKVGDNARLSHVKVQRDGDSAVHLAAIGGEVLHPQIDVNHLGPPAETQPVRGRVHFVLLAHSDVPGPR